MKFKTASPVRIEALDRRLLLAATPVLVKDINLSTVGSAPHDFVDVNGTFFFAASDGWSGNDDLWKTDGTPTGTVRVKDFGPAQGLNYRPLGELTALNGRLLFAATDYDGSNYELWTSDGSEAGTFRVKDIVPGRDGSSPIDFEVVNNTLFFSAMDAAGDTELWKTDGTEAGTVRVKDIWPGPTASNPSFLTNLNGTLYFFAGDETVGTELWKSDGTEAGTVRAVDVRPGVESSGTFGMRAVGSHLFFISPDTDGGMTLWRTDGTDAGTLALRSFVFGSDAFPRLLLDYNGTLIFAADDGETGWELWQSDGTAAGTVLIRDIFAGANSSSPTAPAVLNGTIYFGASDESGGYEVWKSDGTEAGTVRFKDIVPGVGGSNPEWMTTVNGAVYFAANSVASGDAPNRELWKTDGTDAGTVPVADIAPGILNSNPTYLAAGRNRLYFVPTEAGGDQEPWVSDGTAAGTLKLSDINRAPLGSNPDNFIDVNGTIFFTAGADPSVKELWKSDGTAGGTTRVGDVLVSPFLGGVNVNGILYFTGYDPQGGWELWRSDGTEAGTVRVKDTVPGPNESRPGYAIQFNGTVLFSNAAAELWKTDGTEAGTVRVSSDMRPVTPFVISNGAVYFGAYDADDIGGTTGALWKTDSTTSGTIRVAAAMPSELVDVNGTLYFRGEDPTFGSELWKSDGTATGTVMVKDIFPGSSSFPFFLTALSHSLLFFARSDNTFTSHLWKSDGTAAGTQRIGPTVPHGGSVGVVGDTFYFTTWSGNYGLWRSNGSSATQVKEFTVDVPRNLTDVNGTLYFTVPTSGAGNELWTSDGSDAGTVQVADLMPGPEGSFPSGLTVVNGRTLFFGASDPQAGRELWKLELPGVAGRYVFYNDSAFDGRNAAANAADDAAIATDKSALRTGDDPTFDNLTNYTKGLNGIMIDAGGLARPDLLTAADFTFRRRTLGGTAWTTADAPAQVTVRRGAGASGTDRVTLVWPSGAVRNGWLEVTVNANARTGLTSPDVFTFGNAVGDTGGAVPGMVDASDVLRTRAAWFSAAPITSEFDFDRDGRTNAMDLTIVRSQAARPAVGAPQRQNWRPTVAVLSAARERR